MTTLHYTTCKCLSRGNAFTPGTQGNLFAIVNGKRVFLRVCCKCGKK